MQQLSARNPARPACDKSSHQSRSICALNSTTTAQIKIARPVPAEMPTCLRRTASIFWCSSGLGLTDSGSKRVGMCLLQITHLPQNPFCRDHHQHEDEI